MLCEILMSYTNTIIENYMYNKEINNDIYMLFVFKSGGLVMWPLLLCSLLCFYCFIERIIFWRNIKWYNNTIKKNIINHYLNSSTTFVDYLLADKTYPLSSILLKAIKFDNVSDDSFHLALSSALQSEIPSLKKHNNIFTTIITISPLLGLLGTVLGLIDSFSFINLGQAGINNVEVTGGISEALVSTAAGLIVAITSLLFSNYFKIEFQRELPLIQEFLVQFEIARAERNKGI